MIENISAQTRRQFLSVLSGIVIASAVPKVFAAPGIVKLVLTDAQWRKRLSANQYYILRQAGTEPPFDNAYWNNEKPGTYQCAGCSLLLFNSSTKFDSGTGWPSFYEPVSPNVVHTIADNSLDMQRTEVHCAKCDGHLGHVFDDGPQPTGLRYCMDSGALVFVPKK